MQHPQQGYGQPVQPKKGMSGCLIAVLVLAGLVVVGVIVVAIGAWQVMSSPEGKKIARVIGEGSKMAEEARTAPGTKELRKAGCQEAMVFDPTRMGDLIRELSDGGPPKGDPGKEPRLIVCQVAPLGTPPTCDKLASTYVSAAQPTTPFQITVQKQGGSKPKCAQAYTSTGARTATPSGGAEADEPDDDKP